MPVNSRLTATLIIGQRKEFYRQRIPEPSCASKKTADIDIVITCRNGDKNHAIYQNDKQTSLKNKEMEQVQRATKVTPVVNTLAGYILTMSQGLKRGSKWKTNSPAYSFL